jgi:ATP-binding cassette subfamily F protein 3
MINLENISKGFGGQILFEKTGFRINSKERVGLVGRNGHGKTTLFKVIIGAEPVDDGQVMIPKNYRIGHVEQHLAFTEDTVLAEGARGLPAEESDQHWKVEKILAGLGFSDTDMERHPNDFSGGYQVRLNLAKVLVSEPDLLLLDEPTNYLDITSIRWIVRFLNQWPRELLLITHDRGFMDQVVTHTVGIHRGKMRKIDGNTEKYYEQIALDEEIYEKTRANEDRRRKEIEQFITRFRAKARLANLVQSRVKTLAKMEKKDKLADIKNLEFSFKSKPFRAKKMLTVEGLRFGYDDGPTLINGLGFTVSAGERVGVIGKNGKGKTTLLRLLAGSLPPAAGEIQYHPQVDVGVFEQTNIQTLVDSRTVAEEILYSHPSVDQQIARNIAGAMMFQGDTALKKVSVLSGGEKSRVMLGKLLVTPVNMLLLDEPTNHLDMDSCDSLMSAIDAFDGAVVMVTHNEMFLHALADRLIVFRENGVEVFDGGYQRFLEKRGWDDDGDARKMTKTPPISGQPAEKTVADVADKEKINKKELRRMRSEVINERSGAVKPLEKKIKAAEKIIDAQETEMAQLNEEMQTASEKSDAAEIARLGSAIHACEQTIEAKFEELERHTEAMEAVQAEYDARIAEIDAMGE